jgi:hypothetical protein
LLLRFAAPQGAVSPQAGLSFGAGKLGHSGNSAAVQARQR